MTRECCILLLEDEPLVLMDLEYAATDEGCSVLTSSSCSGAITHIDQNGGAINVAVLDVSLGGGSTCFPVAKALTQLGIPFLLHTGDLDRHDERVRELRAELIAKPASAAHVIALAMRLASGDRSGRSQDAAD